MDDGAQMELLSREQRKTAGQVETFLSAENR